MKPFRFFFTILCLSSVFLWTSETAQAKQGRAKTPEETLQQCQEDVADATQAFIESKIEAINSCLTTVSKQIVEKGAEDASEAVTECISAFEKLGDYEEGLAAQLSDVITDGCDPDSATNLHTLDDILGTGSPTVLQSLNVSTLDEYCANFGGDGSIDDLAEWIACVLSASECGVDTSITADFPRVLDWLDLVGDSMETQGAPDEAWLGFNMFYTAIDGTPAGDSIPNIQCISALEWAPVCGDGAHNGGEECDDGNTASGDGCGPTCLIEYCGNHIVDPGEACDDGNNISGDGCSANCLSNETCGNGIVDPIIPPPLYYEACDDGNEEPDDGCTGCRIDNGQFCSSSSQCQSGHCVEGVCCESSCSGSCETCAASGSLGTCTSKQSGDIGDCGTGEYCNGSDNFCIAIECGNGALEADEQCDDGNLVDGDGCNASCEVEGCEPSSIELCTSENAYGSCTGTRVCLGDRSWDSCSAAVPSPEVCDYVDNNCDQVVDDPFRDEDGRYVDDENCGACGINCTYYTPLNATGFCDSRGATTPKCAYQCELDYFDTGSSCINEMQVDCIDAAPNYATSIIVPVTITYTDENGWSEPATCEWKCDTGFIQSGDSCVLIQ